MGVDKRAGIPKSFCDFVFRNDCEDLTGVMEEFEDLEGVDGLKVEVEVDDDDWMTEVSLIGVENKETRSLGDCPRTVIALVAVEGEVGRELTAIFERLSKDDFDARIQ